MTTFVASSHGSGHALPPILAEASLVNPSVLLTQCLANPQHNDDWIKFYLGTGKEKFGAGYGLAPSTAATRFGEAGSTTKVNAPLVRAGSSATINSVVSTSHPLASLQTLPDKMKASTLPAYWHKRNTMTKWLPVVFNRFHGGGKRLNYAVDSSSITHGGGGGGGTLGGQPQDSGVYSNSLSGGAHLEGESLPLTLGLRSGLTVPTPAPFSNGKCGSATRASFADLFVLGGDGGATEGAGGDGDGDSSTVRSRAASTLIPSAKDRVEGESSSSLFPTYEQRMASLLANIRDQRVPLPRPSLLSPSSAISLIGDCSHFSSLAILYAEMFYHDGEDDNRSAVISPSAGAASNGVGNNERSSPEGTSSAASAPATEAQRYFWGDQQTVVIVTADAIYLLGGYGEEAEPSEEEEKACEAAVKSSPHYLAMKEASGGARQSGRRRRARGYSRIGGAADGLNNNYVASEDDDGDDDQDDDDNDDIDEDAPLMCFTGRKYATRYYLRRCVPIAAVTDFSKSSVTNVVNVVCNHGRDSNSAASPSTTTNSGAVPPTSLYSRRKPNASTSMRTDPGRFFDLVLPSIAAAEEHQHVDEGQDDPDVVVTVADADVLLEALAGAKKISRWKIELAKFYDECAATLTALENLQQQPLASVTGGGGGSAPPLPLGRTSSNMSSFYGRGGRLTDAATGQTMTLPAPGAINSKEWEATVRRAVLFTQRLKTRLATQYCPSVNSYDSASGKGFTSMPPPRTSTPSVASSSIGGSTAGGAGAPPLGSSTATATANGLTATSSPAQVLTAYTNRLLKNSVNGPSLADIPYRSHYHVKAPSLVLPNPILVASSGSGRQHSQQGGNGGGADAFGSAHHQSTAVFNPDSDFCVEPLVPFATMQDLAATAMAVKISRDFTLTQLSIAVAAQNNFFLSSSSAGAASLASAAAVPQQQPNDLQIEIEEAGQEITLLKENIKRLEAENAAILASASSSLHQGSTANDAGKALAALKKGEESNSSQQLMLDNNRLSIELETAKRLTVDLQRKLKQCEKELDVAEDEADFLRKELDAAVKNIEKQNNAVRNFVENYPSFVTKNWSDALKQFVEFRQCVQEVTSDTITTYLSTNEAVRGIVQIAYEKVHNALAVGGSAAAPIIKQHVIDTAVQSGEINLSSAELEKRIAEVSADPISSALKPSTVIAEAARSLIARIVSSHRANSAYEALVDSFEDCRDILEEVQADGASLMLINVKRKVIRSGGGAAGPSADVNTSVGSETGAPKQSSGYDFESRSHAVSRHVLTRTRFKIGEIDRAASSASVLQPASPLGSPKTNRARGFSMHSAASSSANAGATNASTPVHPQQQQPVPAQGPSKKLVSSEIFNYNEVSVEQALFEVERQNLSLKESLARASMLMKDVNRMNGEAPQRELISKSTFQIVLQGFSETQIRLKMFHRWAEWGLKAQRRALREEVVSIKNQLDTANKKASAAISDSDRLKLSVASLQQEAVALKAQLEEELAAVVRSQTASTDEKVRALETKMIEKEDKLRSLSELSEKAAETAEAWKSKFSTLEERHRLTERRLLEKEREVQSVVDEAEIEKAKSAEKIQIHEKEITRLKTTIAAQKSELEGLHDQFETETASSMNRSLAADDKARAAEKAHREKEAELTATLARIAELETAGTDANERLAQQLKTERARADAAVAAEKKTSDRLFEAEDTAATLTGQVRQLEREREILKQKVAALEQFEMDHRDLEVYEEQMKHLEVENDELRAQYQREHADFLKLKLEKDSLFDVHNDLQREMLARGAAEVRLEEQLKVTSIERDSLSARLNATSRELELSKNAAELATRKAYELEQQLGLSVNSLEDTRRLRSVTSDKTEALRLELEHYRAFTNLVKDEQGDFMYTIVVPSHRALNHLLATSLRNRSVSDQIAEARIGSMKEQFSNVEAALSEASARIESLETSNELERRHHEAEVEDYKARLRANYAETEKIRVDAEVSERKTVALQKRVAELEIDSREQLESQKKSVQALHQVELEVIEKRLQSQQIDVERYRAETEETLADLDAAMERERTLLADLDHKSQELAAAFEVIKDLEAELESQGKQLRDVTASLNALQKSLSEEHAKIAKERETMLEEVDQQREAVEEERRRLNTRVFADASTEVDEQIMDPESQRYETRIIDLQDDIRGLTHDLHLSAARENVLYNESATLKHDLAETKTALEEAIEQMLEAEEDRSFMQVQIEKENIALEEMGVWAEMMREFSFARREKELLGEVEAVRTINAQLEDHIRGLVDETTVMAEELMTNRADHDADIALLTVANERIKALETQMADYEVQKALAATVEGLRESWLEEKIAHKTCQEEKTEAEALFKAEKYEMGERIMSLQEELIKLEAEEEESRRQMREELEMTRRQISSITTEHKAQVAITSREIANKDTEISKMKRSAALMRAVLRDYEISEDEYAVEEHEEDDDDENDENQSAARQHATKTEASARDATARRQVEPESSPERSVSRTATELTTTLGGDSNDASSSSLYYDRTSTNLTENSSIAFGGVGFGYRPRQRHHHDPLAMSRAKNTRQREIHDDDDDDDDDNNNDSKKQHKNITSSTQFLRTRAKIALIEAKGKTHKFLRSTLVAIQLERIASWMRQWEENMFFTAAAPLSRQNHDDSPQHERAAEAEDCLVGGVSPPTPPNPSAALLDESPNSRDSPRRLPLFFEYLSKRESLILDSCRALIRDSELEMLAKCLAREAEVVSFVLSNSSESLSLFSDSARDVNNATIETVSIAYQNELAQISIENQRLAEQLLNATDELSRVADSSDLREKRDQDRLAAFSHAALLALEESSIKIKYDVAREESEARRILQLWARASEDFLRNSRNLEEEIATYRGEKLEKGAKNEQLMQELEEMQHHLELLTREREEDMRRHDEHLAGLEEELRFVRKQLTIAREEHDLTIRNSEFEKLEWQRKIEEEKRKALTELETLRSRSEAEIKEIKATLSKRESELGASLQREESERAQCRAHSEERKRVEATLAQKLQELREIELQEEEEERRRAAEEQEKKNAAAAAEEQRLQKEADEKERRRIQAVKEAREEAEFILREQQEQEEERRKNREVLALMKKQQEERQLRAAEDDYMYRENEELRAADDHNIQQYPHGGAALVYGAADSNNLEVSSLTVSHASNALLPYSHAYLPFGIVSDDTAPSSSRPEPSADIFTTQFTFTPNEKGIVPPVVLNQLLEHMNNERRKSQRMSETAAHIGEVLRRSAEARWTYHQGSSTNNNNNTLMRYNSDNLGGPSSFSRGGSTAGVLAMVPPELIPPQAVNSAAIAARGQLHVLQEGSSFHRNVSSYNRPHTSASITPHNPNLAVSVRRAASPSPSVGLSAVGPFHRNNSALNHSGQPSPVSFSRASSAGYKGQIVAAQQQQQQQHESHDAGSFSRLASSVSAETYRHLPYETRGHSPSRVVNSDNRPPRPTREPREERGADSRETFATPLSRNRSAYRAPSPEQQRLANKIAQLVLSHQEEEEEEKVGEEVLLGRDGGEQQEEDFRVLSSKKPRVNAFFTLNNRDGNMSANRGERHLNNSTAAAATAEDVTSSRRSKHLSYH